MASSASIQPFRFRNPRALCLVAWAVLAAFVLASQGFVPSAERLAKLGIVAANSERFPCEGCACGCHTAEQCWAHCCCHSVAERLAWAERAGVLVPRAFAQVAFARIQSDAKNAHLPPCCARADAEACCSADERGHDHAHAHARLPSVGPLRCKGAHGWLVLAAVLPARLCETARLTNEPDPVGMRLSLDGARPESRVLERAPRPPRA